MDIKTAAARDRLPARRDPYFERIEATLFVGVRKMATDGDVHWLARMVDPASNKRVFKALGTLVQHPDGSRWGVAKREAEAWYRHVLAGGAVKPHTVADVCAAYVQHLLTETKTKRTPEAKRKAAEDVERRFNQYVLDDPRFAATEVLKLTRSQIKQWRERLAARPVHRGSGHAKGASKPTDKVRSASSLNRDITPFRAALNHAHALGWLTSDVVWRKELEPIAGADKRREGAYIDREQARQLIAAAEQDGSGIAPFLRALANVPLRPGAMAGLKVKDFNARQAMLHISTDKTGSRDITLPPGAAAIFADACRGKTPAAPIFARPDGSAWDKDSWKKPVRRAVEAAGLPATVVAYSLRHAGITAMANAGVPLLTIAQITGTSLRMIESNYGHLEHARGAEAMSRIAI